MNGEPSALERRIARGAVAHYEDAVYYDLAYRRRRADVRLYRELAQEHPGPVLELGVGTGRVALALAKDGVELVGVEPVQAMLALDPLPVARRVTVQPLPDRSMSSGVALP